jgi:hypothetical protein
VNDATAAEKNAAAATYKSAMAAFDKNEFEAALKGFRESYDKVKSPNSRFMIARTLARLGRNAEAYEELNGVIADAGELGPKYEDTVHAAYAKLDEIKPRIGFVVVTVEHGPKDATVMVGDDKLAAGRLGKPVAVLPGETAVTVSAPGKDKRTQKVQVEAGATAEVKFDLATRDPTKPPPEPVYHAPYRVELEASVVGETLAPPYPVTRGAGAGIRAAFPVVDRGVLGSMDNFALSTGLDWIGTSSDPILHPRTPMELPDQRVQLEVRARRSGDVRRWVDAGRAVAVGGRPLQDLEESAHPRAHRDPIAGIASLCSCEGGVVPIVLALAALAIMLAVSGWLRPSAQRVPATRHPRRGRTARRSSSTPREAG